MWKYQLIGNINYSTVAPHSMGDEGPTLGSMSDLYGSLGISVSGWIGTSVPEVHITGHVVSCGIQSPMEFNGACYMCVARIACAENGYYRTCPHYDGEEEE
jgi:hypothetical protein